MFYIMFVCLFVGLFFHAYSGRIQVIGDDARRQYNLQIDPVRSDDAGDYRCLLTASETDPEVSSQPATLTVSRKQLSLPASPNPRSASVVHLVDYHDALRSKGQSGTTIRSWQVCTTGPL